MPREPASPTSSSSVREIAEVRVDVSVVRDVVAPVQIRGGVDGRQPDAIDAEPSQVVEMLDDPSEVADPVAVRVREGPNVDLVQDPVAPPSGIVVRHEPSIPAVPNAARHYPARR